MEEASEVNHRVVLTLSLLSVFALGVCAAPALGMAPVMNFRAHLSGKEWVSRVDPSTTYAIDTSAQGQVIFQLQKGGTELYFKLIVANIQNVTMAHIHIDNGEKVGPIVVWLYPRNPPLKLIPGRFDGVLAEGTITEANLVGELEGHPLSDLIAKIQEGLAYVVVHTSQHPPGEIRGWIN